jgi:hypothetical protein
MLTYFIKLTNILPLYFSLFSSHVSWNTVVTLSKTHLHDTAPTTWRKAKYSTCFYIKIEINKQMGFSKVSANRIHLLALNGSLSVQLGRMAWKYLFMWRNLSCIKGRHFWNMYSRPHEHMNQEYVACKFTTPNIHIFKWSYRIQGNTI